MWHTIQNNFDLSIYLQELAAASSETCCSDIDQSEPAKSTSTAGKFCCRDSGTDTCQGFQSGMTSGPLTENRGKEKSILLQADSPARIYRQAEKGRESAAKEAVYGERWQELFMKFDPATYSLKTHHCLWEEVLQLSSVILPRWGMMQDGELWERATPERRIGGTESGLWPTPKAAAAGPDFAKIERSSTGISLQTAVAKYPTPTSRDWKDTPGMGNNRD